MTKDEALQYLKDRGLDDERAAQIYELVGGRVIHLNSVANELIEGKKNVQGMYGHNIRSSMDGLGRLDFLVQG